MLENTRFVRQVSIDPAAPYLPFAALYLAGAPLAGLDLACRDHNRGPDDDSSCADLRNADLRNADLFGADLAGADLAGARLAGADLAGANLAGANLAGADLAGADLRFADVRGADLTLARLQDANLGLRLGVDIDDPDQGIGDSICYDDATLWPHAFLPTLPPVCHG